MNFEFAGRSRPAPEDAMQCAETHNSTWAAAVRAAARQGRLSHALILTGVPLPAISPRPTFAAAMRSAPACNATPAAR